MRKLALTITAVAALGLSLPACKKNEPFVIKVGNEKITENDLNDKLSATSADFQKFAATPIGRKHFFDLVVQQSVVIEAAKKAGIEKQAEFKKALEDFKNEQQKQLADYKDGLLMDIYLKEIREKIKASDNEIQNYYNENKSTFEKPIAYTVRHILVSDKETAQNAYERLKNGAKFEQVAKEVSKDTTAQNGGLLGPVKQGALVPEFEVVALKLKNNEMSEVIETRYGFHIILKVSEQKLSPIPPEEAKENIKRIVEKDKFDAWFNKEKENLGVEVNYGVPSSESEQQK
ncbi:MAG: peptidylprolyl isomerase [Endomicrobium sp.]|nr:peptidylprolyl isomerase [Endomicrobium sp.]MDR2427441.1 peptidylprolyl isomerase [Endomicrobium sp.]